MAIESNAVVFASTQTEIPAKQIMSVLTLMLEEDCTVPFIARYRKERTGGLDEIQIRAIRESYDNYIEREKRREFILETIKKMELLTPELEKEILKASTINQLEDIYAPYKSKKKTKGMLAKDAGLEPLADIIMTSQDDIISLAQKHGTQFINPEHKIMNFQDAMKGACDIIIEKFAHDSELKEKLRKAYWDDAKLISQKREGAETIKDFHKYQDYFEFSGPVAQLKDPKNGHRFLAMRRGMTEKILKVEVTYEEEKALNMIKHKYLQGNLGLFDVVYQCAKKAYSNSIHPSLDLEIKSELKKLADESAIEVFGINLKNLLLQPYLGAKAVMGIDPGVRTGCKIAIVDQTGKYLADTVIYPHPPHNNTRESKLIIETALEQLQINHIAIGNGTYGRETLDFIETNIKQVKDGAVKVTLISESGASIYSASEIAQKEFPDKDLTVRGAISIARRFQDPLAELVKIDPKSIGVGQYQHDVNQTRLKTSLNDVVESCVNYVGVDLNTASAPLLSYISGIGPSVAENIVKYREEKGTFTKREDLLKIKRFSSKIFEQAAGFLRIYNGPNPLDGTFIHPERYQTLSTWAEQNNITIDQLIKDSQTIEKLNSSDDLKKQIGEFTLNDIVKSLKAPSQDPRTEFKSLDFRKDVRDLKDLEIGQWYPGQVTNITRFGAFIDIGIKENGLVHISEISDTFVENALDALKVGQEVKARVISVDFDRKRVALSLKIGDKKSANFNQTQNTNTGKRALPIKEQEFKNNAFSALKNIKITK